MLCQWMDYGSKTITWYDPTQCLAPFNNKLYQVPYCLLQQKQYKPHSVILSQIWLNLVNSQQYKPTLPGADDVASFWQQLNWEVY